MHLSPTSKLGYLSFNDKFITSHNIQESYGLYYLTYYVNRKYIINQILIENNVLLM